MQWGDPAREDVPAMHGVHTVDESAPFTSDAVPAGHGVHSELPAPAENLPAWQVLH